MGVNYNINGDGSSTSFPLQRPTSISPLSPSYDDVKFLGNAFCGLNKIKLKADV